VRPESSCGYVFLSQSGGPTMVMAVQLMLKRLKDQVGLDRLHPHLLRRTFARIYLEWIVWTVALTCVILKLLVG
jgi:integrase